MNETSAECCLIKSVLQQAGIDYLKFWLTFAALAVTALFFKIWKKVRRFFDSKQVCSNEEKREEAVKEEEKEEDSPIILEGEMERQLHALQKMTLGLDDNDQYDNDGYIDDTHEMDIRNHGSSRPAPSWIDGPRDITTLPEIIQSTYSDFEEEADYAVKQMLSILQFLSPLDDYLDITDEIFQSIECRIPPATRDKNGKVDYTDVLRRFETDKRTVRLTTSQLSSIFDALPFLFETCASFQRLEKYTNVLSSAIVGALEGNSAVRRQCISVITILLERNVLSQEFLQSSIVPGLFDVYKSGVGTFNSNDLRMETVQALCQLISYDIIKDREWIFEKFVAPFSAMLKDSAMHVRKNALQIFGNLGNLFGEKFTEVFLVPHLVALSYDLNWAVRKAACETYVRVAECSPADVRSNVLAENFVRLLNDPNKWVSFVAYQQLGPFIALFADSEITGLKLINGVVCLKELIEQKNTSSSELNGTFVNRDEDGEETKNGGDGNAKFGELADDVYLPSDLDLEYASWSLSPTTPLNTTITIAPMATTNSQDENKGGAVAAAASTSNDEKPKTPKRGERVMGSVLSGLNKMLSPFERATSSSSSSSPKTAGGKEIVGTGTFGKKSSSSPLHSAVNLMDKWSRRNNPNNPQRFSVFEEASTQESEDQKSSSSENVGILENGVGIAAKCNSTDDLSKLGLDDEEVATSTTTTMNCSSKKSLHQSPLRKSKGNDSPIRRTASPKVQKTRAKQDIRQKVFLRRLGVLGAAAASSSSLSPKKTVVRKLSTESLEKTLGCIERTASPIKKAPMITVFDFAEPEELGGRMRSNGRKPPPNYEDEEDGVNLDASFVEREEGEGNESSEEEAVENSVSKMASVVEEVVPLEFSLTYWSADCNIDFTEDELKPFGSSNSSAESYNYIENRMDIIRTNASPRSRSNSFGSPGAVKSSPRRTEEVSTEVSGSCSTTMINTEEKEKLGILDLMDEMDMSISSNSSDGRENEEESRKNISIEDAAFAHVPCDLVDAYLSVIGPIGNSGSIVTGDQSLCAEIYRHCAYNFPAVCYTLGRGAWPRLKYIFTKLALDEQPRVRQSISHSIHEIANMMGEEIADNDLMPIFCDLRNDQHSDVRGGILSHLYEFVRCLSPVKRAEIILSLPQFFPIGAQPGNQVQNGDWRSRFELISQLVKLCSLYNVDDVNIHMSGIALTLADDRVAEVRKEAVLLVGTIVGTLVQDEWEEIRKVRDVMNGHNDEKEAGRKFLSEQFVDDIVASFARTQKWTRRQTFCFISAQTMKDGCLNVDQFRYFFAKPLRQLSEDKVPNVRIASCDALFLWRNMLLETRFEATTKNIDEEASADEINMEQATQRDIVKVAEVMKKLADEDDDIDVAYLAKLCQGKPIQLEPVDVETRSQKMRDREEEMFGDLCVLVDGKMKRMLGSTFIEMKKKNAFLPKAPIADVEQDIEVLEDELNSSNEEKKVEERVEIQKTVDNLVDNTEVVDMEIEEEDDGEKNVPQQQAQLVDVENVVNKTAVMEIKDEDDVEVPMDPAPSTTSQPNSPLDSEA